MSRSPLEHPANAGLRRRFEHRELRAGLAPLTRPDDVEQPYLTLGTHPDLVARLLDELAASLTDDCRVVFYGTPALMHPATGVVFAFAGGTHTYAMCLPEPERAVAIAAGATRVHRYPAGQPDFDLAEIGPEWLFGKWLPAEPHWCVAAFQFAGRRSP